MSPLLFAIYLNDFEYYVSRQYRGLAQLSHDISLNLSNDDVEIFLRLYVLLYADDTMVMAESPQELQLVLNAVCDYCHSWKLKVNTDKTKVMIFSKGKVNNSPVFGFGTDTINVVDDYVYLGVKFNSNGSFKKAISKQVTRSSKESIVWNVVQS